MTRSTPKDPLRPESRRGQGLGDDNPFIRNVAVFPLDVHSRFAIDRVELSCYLERSRSQPVRVRLREDVRADLVGRNNIRRVNGRLLAFMTQTFTVCLPDARGDGSITGYRRDNVLRRIRTRFIKDGRYPANAKSPGARSDNFLDAAHLPPRIDLHAECLAELITVVDDARAAYQEAIWSLFGLTASPRDITVSISAIELCWDVPSLSAMSAATLWAPAWRDANRGASIGVGKPALDHEALPSRRVEATDHRETDAINGTGVLRADAADGGGLKLYAKHDRLLRFEAEFSRKRTSKLLGHRIRVDTSEHLASDLERLAEGAYRRLLAAQANLTCRRTLSLAGLIAAFLPSGDGERIRSLIEAFESGHKFHHVGRTHERILNRLKSAGLVEYLGRGVWAPMSVLHTTFKRVQYLRTHSEGPA